MSNIAVIGSGFSGLSTACYLAKAGHTVHVYEKNSTPGGRARQLITDNGFTFDMGPSWYWMPDVFERFFSDFGYSVSDFYNLTVLTPAFDIAYGKHDLMHVPQNFEELCNLFDEIEKSSSIRLRKFMKEAEFKYKTGMENLVYKPGLSISEFADWNLLKGVLRLQVFSSFSKHVRTYFKHPKLLALMEFPVLFLGAMPEETPALYSLMNYAGLTLGTYYPQGGFGSVINAFVQLAEGLGVQFHYNSPVDQILITKGKASGIRIANKDFEYDGVIASADYHHVEEKLLKNSNRNYSEDYWEKKTFAPSCLIYYIGIGKKIQNINHHTLFFDEDFTQHSIDIYKTPQWPSKPLFYVCCPSKTDDTVAPSGCENLFFLMPIAAGIKDEEVIREQYFDIMLQRFEHIIGEGIREDIMYKKSYCVNDFVTDYNAYKGNAYGLANTLKQTAIFKPKIKNKKVEHLYYTGQLTVPGPGVPPSIISGRIAADLLHKQLKSNHYETVI